MAPFLYVSRVQLAQRTADVIFVAHAGLDNIITVRELYAAPLPLHR